MDKLFSDVSPQLAIGDLIHLCRELVILCCERKLILGYIAAKYLHVIRSSQRFFDYLNDLKSKFPSAQSQVDYVTKHRHMSVYEQ